MYGLSNGTNSSDKTRRAVHFSAKAELLGLIEVEYNRHLLYDKLHKKSTTNRTNGACAPAVIYFRFAVGIRRRCCRRPARAGAVSPLTDVTSPWRH